MQYVDTEQIDTLWLEYYPEKRAGRSGSVSRWEGSSRYEHYQDNGLDFAYENGEYNLYAFTFHAMRKNGIKVQMLHEGYGKKYKEIKAVVR